MLLLNEVNRLSTDCDIIVPVDYDIDKYIKDASVIYPFKSFSESIRKTNNNISKKQPADRTSMSCEKFRYFLGEELNDREKEQKTAENSF